VGRDGGYEQSNPLCLHLSQAGSCLPHRRFAFAHASHAFEDEAADITGKLYTMQVLGHRQGPEEDTDPTYY